MEYRTDIERRDRADSAAGQLARGLGWFSIAFGLAEIAAPQALSRALGMEGRETLLRAYGLREIANGAAILVADDPGPAMWARVAGDGLDIASLIPALREDNPKRGNAALALGAVAGITLLDLVCARSLSNDEGARPWVRDYSDRSGLPRPPEEMRGAARDFAVPRDMRAPEALRPYSSG
jgi:hypothetical protein